MQKQKIAFITLALLSYISAAPVIAAPHDATVVGYAQPDEMQGLLESKGLLQQLGQNLSGHIVQSANQVAQLGQSVGERTSNLVSTAMGLIGVPYRLGGNSIETGFDCSGFVRAIFKDTLGLVLPRSAAQQAKETQAIDKTELKPGDLVFFNTMKRAFSHVGVYLGEGKFIHAPRSGASVRIEDMRIPYWNVRFDGARRVQAVALSDSPLQKVSASDASVGEMTLR